MVGKILLGVPEVGHDANERIGDRISVLRIRGGREILDDEVLDFRQLAGDTLVVVLMFLKQSLILMLDVGADFCDELVVAA